MATTTKSPSSAAECLTEMAFLFSKSEELVRSSLEVIEKTNALILDSSILLCALRSRNPVGRSRFLI